MRTLREELTEVATNSNDPVEAIISHCETVGLIRQPSTEDIATALQRIIRMISPSADADITTNEHLTYEAFAEMFTRILKD